MSHKKPKEKRKQQKKLAQKTRALSRRREIYNYLFKVLKIEDQISQLPSSIRALIYDFSHPQIQIDSSEVRSVRSAEHLTSQIEQALEESTIKINDEEVPLNWVGYIFALHGLIKSMYADTDSLLNGDRKEKLNKKKHHVAASIFDSLNYINSKITPIANVAYLDYLNEICNNAARLSLVHYNFENGLYPQLKILKTESLKSYPAIILKKLNIKKTTLELDGKPRTAYPLVNFTFYGLKPLVIEKGVLENDEVLPIYIQDHAMTRLAERINIAPQGYLNDCLGRSLANPKVVGVDGDAYLVEFYLYSYKVGYLVVSKTKNFALIRSFKFITMTGTPEFNQISKILRATKHDVTYLGLDTLEILVNSDISKDPELRSVFEKCGLEDLFRLSEINMFETPKNYVADEIKQYFSIAQNNSND
jgi:hypothetical protein